MGSKKKYKVILPIALLTLTLVGCSQQQESITKMEKIEPTSEQFKLFQPLTVEIEGDTNSVISLERTKAMVSTEEPIVVGLIKDVFSQENIELESILNETIPNYSNVKQFITETPDTDAITSYVYCINQLIGKGATVIVIQNERGLEALESVVPNYPDVIFVTVDSFIKSPNVLGIKFREEAVSYLAGVVSAIKTKTNKIGFIDSTQSQQANDLAYIAYLAGATQVNPNIIVDRKTVSDSKNKSEVKTKVASMYDNNVDIIYEQLCENKIEVVQVAKELRSQNKMVWVINSDVNLYEEGKLNSTESVVLTSTKKQLQLATDQVMNSFSNGEFNSGNQIILGLDNNGVNLDISNPMLSQEIVLLIEEFEQKIINGEIMIPSSLDAVVATK